MMLGKNPWRAVLCLLLLTGGLSLFSAPAEAKRIEAGDHFEVTFGFLAGQRSYEGTTFAYDEGEGSSSLVAPFASAPFDSVPVYGLRYDLRLVIFPVRMMVGLDLPFSSFDSQRTTRSYMVDDKLQEVRVQSLSPYELRFGLGLEYQFGRVAPFVDLVGAVHWVDAELSIGEAQATYTASSFGFAARGGLRVELRRWFFVTASAEVGLVGNSAWSTDLSVGFRI